EVNTLRRALKADSVVMRSEQAMRRLNARAAPLLRDCLAVARACERLGARDRVQVTNPPISAHIRKHPHTQPPTGIIQICRDFAGSMAQARVSLKIVVSPVRFWPSRFPGAAANGQLF